MNRSSTVAYKGYIVRYVNLKDFQFQRDMIDTGNTNGFAPCEPELSPKMKKLLDEILSMSQEIEDPNDSDYDFPNPKQYVSVHWIKQAFESNE